MPRPLLRNWLLCGLCLHAAACSDSNDEPRESPGIAVVQNQTPGAAGSGTMMGGAQPGAMADLFAPSDRSVHPSAGCSNENAIMIILTRDRFETDVRRRFPLRSAS